MESKMKSSKLTEGLELEITHHPLTMKRVVNLIIAMERFKGTTSEPLLSTEFRDESLLNIVLDNFVEAQTVFERSSQPSVQYNKMEEDQFSVVDGEKRSLVQVPNSMELHAVMLQGGSDNCKVHLNMSTYVDSPPSTEARPVVLGIKDTNLYLSCHKDGEEPSLHLERVDDKSSLSRISSNSDMVRFLFYKQDLGLNLSTLVSVPFNNWYISTAVEDNKPVEMCLESARRHRNFTIQRMQNTPAQECTCTSEGQV
nr:interleukin-1 beta-like isoform X2 [Scatophagus argus]